MDNENILSDHSAESVKPWEPWRCTVCQVFVYNMDEHGNPAPGAPTPRFVSKDYPIVCQVCWAMYAAVDKSDYMTKLNREDETRNRRLKRLKPGEDYFNS